MITIKGRYLPLDPNHTVFLTQDKIRVISPASTSRRIEGIWSCFEAVTILMNSDEGTKLGTIKEEKTNNKN